MIIYKLKNRSAMMRDDEQMPSGVRMQHPNRQNSKEGDVKKHNGYRNQTVKKTDQPAGENNQVVIQAEELPGILYKSLFEQLASYQSDCCIHLYSLPQSRPGSK
jgi:hypothetical protein